ncbi:hypothetical protein CYMTET_20566 [Cymbomonas tetramitiformis]|uniref:Uncharacterized protein n=1 Tax=Cymbomonas tetramitiformis TaxID=36881 RepID=A0AAE0G4I3_9CHLO|nr:hypothetical protein CYMTET_20566 [Cymbomonas tetramitiformis]
MQPTYSSVCVTEGIDAGNRGRCDCHPGQANANNFVSTDEDAAVCNLCGVVVQAYIMFHPVNRHEAVSEDHQGSYRESLGCSGPVYSVSSKERPPKRRRTNGACRVELKLEELKNDPTATLDAPQTYDKRLICVRDAWIEFIQNDSAGISAGAVEDFPKLIKLVYDGDFNNKILLNDMLHLCKTYLVGMPHVLAKLVVLRKAVKPRKGPKKGKRTLVA